MECDLCGTVNRANARFCGGCGSALALRCPNCKAELDAGLSFCDQCGTTLEAAPRGAAPPTAGAVRKTVTVLFADLGGSTGFGERTDPEISRLVLAQYHALLQETIDAHRGTVAKFMGDGMMATFGIPEVAEDDARRAVLAGVDVQRRFEAFAADVSARYGETLTMRVGINTGEVVIAAGDADLVGDALNVAARLEKACRPGHVLVGDETWRITRGDLAYEPLGEVTVAGRAGPVGTYEVIASGAATADPVAPFVGRLGETTRLRAAFDRARTDESAVLVTVLGSPGMGKTRLSRELASTLATGNEATTFEIRCDRSGGATFAPFADLVREAAGIAEIEEGEHAADVTRDRIGALVRDDADRGRVVDVLAGVLGAAPARSVEETFWGLRRVIESLATDRPLLVVIDDIQWAEPKLLDLLEHLAEWVQSAAVLLVCLARPELRDLRPSLTEPGRRVADVLALDGLDASATAELASGLLGSALPTELIDRLPVSTDGNPLFVRELVRMLVDDAVIRRRADGAWELAIDAEAIEVPPTIQSLLATRVERLPTEELRVLELASVVGAEFSVGALRELAGDDIAVPPVLERLRRKELVEPTGSYWGDDPLHRFHHVLIRDAAYRRLLKTTRAELHRRVGEWTDSIAADLVGEQETAIAFHYEQAHRYRMELGTVDDETDRLGRRAAELLSVAARRALDREDLTSAGALARRALAALPAADVDDRADLLLIACECFLSSGDVTAGAPLVDALDALSGDNEQLAAWAACYRAQLIGLTDPEGVVAAEAMASAAATTLASLGDGAGEAKAHQVRALLLARLGRVGEAEMVLDLALGAARASDDRRRVTAVLGAAPQAALFGPSPVARAGGRCLDVVRLLRITTASPSVEATSMRCQAVLEALRGRFDVSRSMLASARASLEELGLRHGLLETDLFTGMVELIAGDPGSAIDPLRSAYEGLGTLGVGADAGQAAALLATALLAQGEIDEAELMAGASEALAGQNLKTAIAWRIARAEVHAARGDAAAGVTVAEEAVQIAAGTDLILDHADACVVLADLRDAAGDPAGARVARADALRLYEAKGATVPAGRLSDVSSRGEGPGASPTTSRDPVAAPRRGETRTAVAENAASRFLEQLRVALNAGEYEAAGRLTADSYVFDDRRSIVAVPDVEALTSDTQEATAQGFVILEPEVVAVRGQQLCLRRLVYRTPAGDESPRLVVDELGPDGRLARSVFFSPDEVAAALAELDARFYLGEGAPFQRVLQAAGRYAAASYVGDLDGIRDHLADDFVVVDHQPLGFGEGDREYFVEMRRLAETELAGLNRVLHLNEHALLAVYVSKPITDQGTVYERSGCIVMGVDASGRVSRIEMFADDDFAAALARLDELGAAAPTDPRTPAAENDASRFLEPLRVAFNGKDRGALARLIAPDYVHDDRRSIVASVGLDPRGRMDDIAATIDQGFSFAEPVIIAVRGERLALSRMVTRTAAGDESPRLSVNELDAEGRMVRSTLFDEEDLAGAIAELDDWYLAGEGAPYRAVLRAGTTMNRLHRERDWDAYRASLTDDFRFVDHRHVGFVPGGPDDLVEVMRSGVDVAPDMVQIARKLFVADRVGLTVLESTGHSTDGGAHEWMRFGLTMVADDGRLERLEWFGEHDFETALAAFDALRDWNPESLALRATRSAAVTNRATEALVMGMAMLNADPRHARSATEAGIRSGFISPDMQREDHRRVVGSPTIADGDDFATEVGAMFGVFDRIDVDPVAVRGEQLTLVRLRCVREPDFESTWLALYEFDEQGRMAHEIDFDDDHLPEALAKLDAAYYFGEGAPYQRLLTVCGKFGSVSLRNDTAALADLVAPGFVFTDRRLLGYGDGDLQYLLDAGYTGLDRVEGSVVDRVLHLVGSTLLTVQRWLAISETGSEFEQVTLFLVHVDESGLVDRLELYDEDDFATALTRLDELGGAAPADRQPSNVENGTSRLMVRTAELAMARRFDELRGMLADEFTRADHRTGVSAPMANGPDEFVVAYASWFEVGFERLAVVPVAVRGELLVLSRLEWSSADGRAVVFLGLYETNDDGGIVCGDHYDEDDLDAALEALDQRFLAGEGAEHLAVLVAGQMWIDASRTQDLDALRAITAPGLVCVDHSPLGFGTLDRDGLLVATQLRFELSADDVVIVRSVQVDGNAVLGVHYAETTTESGGRYEREACYLLAVDGAGLIDRWEVFGDGEYDRALTRLHELGAVVPTDPRTAKAENLTTRLLARTIGHLVNRRFDLMRELLVDDFVRDDRRHGVSAPYANGPDEWIAHSAANFDVGFDAVDSRPIAVRGEHLALFRIAWTSTDGRFVPFLSVFESDGVGRLVHGTHFDEHDLVTALSELDERFMGAAVNDPFNARDWAAMTERFHPDLIVVDRRELMWPELDRDAFVEMQRGYVELVPDMVFSTRVMHFQGPAMLLVLDSMGTTVDGGPVEWHMVSVALLGDDGLILRLELFDESDFAGALARLDELGAVAATSDALGNQTTRVLDQFFELLVARRFDDAAALMDPAFEHLDRRSILANDSIGREETMANNRAIVEMGFDDIELATVAVRGERLALVRGVFRTAAGDEMHALMLQETNDLGLRTLYLGYDPEDLAAAFDELNERYLAGEGAEHEYLVRRLSDFRTVQSARDWNAFEALVAADFALVDHRPMGFPDRDRAGYVDVMRATDEQTPGGWLIHRSLDVRGDVVLARTGRVGATPDGLDYEWEQTAVMVWAAGLLRRVELFAVVDAGAAQARFEELAYASELTPYIDNRIVRLGARAQWLGRFTDERPEFYRDDCVLDDRRPGVNAGTVHGAEAVGASIQSGVEVFGVLEIDWLAVRGDRLGLNRWAFVAEGGFEAPGVSVIELDENDLVSRVTSFQEPELALAIDHLEQRHVELRGDAVTPQELTTAVGSRAFNARDWDAMAEVFARDIRFATHAPFTTEGGWDDYLAQLRVLVEQVPDVAVVFAKVTTRGRCGLSLLPFTGTTPEGSRYSWSMVQVTRMGDDGLIAEFELFDIEQWGDAVACFERWVADSDATTDAARARSIENMASRLTAEAARGFGREGYQELEHRADDLVRVDHRRMIGVPTTTTREEFADAAKAFAGLGMTDLTFDVLAVRGDRCCLGRLTYSGADFGVGFLTVVACNDQDKMAWIDNFDEEDFGAAYDMLDDRFIAGEGAEHAHLIRRIGDFGHAYRDRDWAALVELFAPDAVLADHRSIGQAWHDRADFVTSSRAVIELAPDVRHVIQRLEMRGGTWLSDGEASGTTSDGSGYTWGYHLVGQCTAGRITCLEIFDTADEAAARARLEELARESRTPQVDNDAVWVQERLAWFGARGDLDGARSLLAPDLLAIDRRPGVAAPDMVGPDARLANLAAVAEVFERIDVRVIAVSGDRLTLLGWTISADGFAATGYDVTEIDDDGQICRIVTFDESQLPTAYAELETRHRAVGEESSLVASPAALAQTVSDAFAARDWDWIRTRVAADVVLEDRRSTVSSHRAVGSDAVTDLFRGFAEVGFTSLVNTPIATRGDRLVLLRRVYRTVTGFELDMLAVVESGADGLMRSLVLFDADAMVPALDELEIRYARSGAMTRIARSPLVGFAALNHRRWSEFDTLLAPDVEVVDHRRLGFPAATGPGDLVHALQSLVVQVPDVVAIVTGLETAGDAVLAVVEQRGTSADGVAADWRWYNVILVDRAGRISCMEYFDADDEMRARTRFEELGGTDS